jgi:uncharacterized membrane protein YphA (DoxX/SURF4 family)
MGGTTFPGPHGGPSTSISQNELGVLSLRWALGCIWALNMIFIFDPANGFFPTFSATASSFATSSLGGSGFPNFVAAQPWLFSGLIAAVTTYLAVAFLFGLTTRIACIVGTGFAAGLLVSQFGITFIIPGGTDVGPMPLYIGMYVALFISGSAPRYSLDAVLRRAWIRRRVAADARRASVAPRPTGESI